MSTKGLNLGSGVKLRPPDTHGYPGGGGVVFSDDPGQVESIFISVLRTNQGPSRANIEKDERETQNFKKTKKGWSKNKIDHSDGIKVSIDQTSHKEPFCQKKTKTDLTNQGDKQIFYNPILSH